MKPKILAVERKIIELPNEELAILAESIISSSLRMRDELIKLQNEFADSLKNS